MKVKHYYALTTTIGLDQLVCLNSTLLKTILHLVYEE